MNGIKPVDQTVRWFWVLVIAHLIVWTAVPILTQPNTPIDNAEMLYWGHEWQWGYYKHPPLPAWSAEAAAVLLGDPVWPTYLLSQICIVGCFWAAWKLGREVLTPWQALAAAFLLESSIYYNYTTPEFNNNIMAKVCWALFAVFIYFGMTRRRIIHWAAAGVFLGAAFLSKYDAALLLMAVLFFSVANARARACWRTPGPYVLIGVALLLFAPHLWWLVSNDYPTIRYVMARSSADAPWFAPLSFPAGFLAAQIGAVGITLLVAMIALGWRWKIKPIEGHGDFRFHRTFVLCVVIGPLALALLFSVCTGAYIRSMWGASMFTFLGVLLFSWFEASQKQAYLRGTVCACATVGVAFAVALGGRNLFGSGLMDHSTRTDFPGKRLAEVVERIWREREHTPLKHVGGDWWVAANVNIYHALRPSVYAELDSVLSPWTDEQAWLRDGGVVVWDIQLWGDSYRQWVQHRCPSAQILTPILLDWTKTPGRAPLRIGIAVVPSRPDGSRRIVERKVPDQR